MAHVRSGLARIRRLLTFRYSGVWSLKTHMSLAQHCVCPLYIHLSATSPRYACLGDWIEFIPPRSICQVPSLCKEQDGGGCIIQDAKVLIDSFRVLESSVWAFKIEIRLRPEAPEWHGSRKFLLRIISIPSHMFWGCLYFQVLSDSSGMEFQ